MIRRSGRRFWGTGVVAVCILLGGSTLAVGQVRIGVGIAVPGLSIGINIPAYPNLVPIPGYPVYYAPGLSENLFFYDGQYWVFAGDNWYYSSWYDGPWYLSQPELVPDFILRIPILYYRRPPSFFFGWNREGPPRWGEHWGRTWEEHRRGWDQWNRASVPARAPLPSYQRQYPHGRYPGPDQQRSLENRYYPYRPSDSRDRSRLQQAPRPQFGQRIAPQPNRPAPQRRQPQAPPQAQRVPPGAMQRPPAFNRPSPPVRAERRAPEANRPGPRPGVQPAQPRNNSGPAGRQEKRKEPPPRGDGAHERHPPDRPPG